MERLIATKYCNVYEKKVSRVFPSFLSFISVILSLIWILFSNKDIINEFVNIFIHISALAFSLLGTVILLYQNKKLEKEYKRKLTERYIIKDNIRIAKFLLPRLLIINLGEIILLMLYVYFGLSMKKFPIIRGDIIFYSLIIFGPILWNLIIIMTKILTKLKVTNLNENVFNMEKNNEGCVYFSNLNQQWELT
ncbi:7TM GPCR, serpentine receptor class e (Sre) family-containing protein [Strongyloides ratti]|uniref:7TM GPCR, serpentine receptor class e (Sre) family-containing protein n=1 Tax=Strongyloides ratti TaxID=34506 RepID=A0A090LGM0_STRRB|nr:7TM GPCR, serpentine receptor class e (Sre) family-containing protein [Strongyloides ratti]CEF68946.1 7TM GPCR, serpentine receptor class e (Sre) family-containing protein [Strongyloides ratti]